MAQVLNCSEWRVRAYIPVQFQKNSVTIGEKAMAISSLFFSMGNEVACITDSGVDLRDAKPNYWIVAAKVAVFTALMYKTWILAAALLISHLALRSAYPYFINKRILFDGTERMGFFNKEGDLVVGTVKNPNDKTERVGTFRKGERLIEGIIVSPKDGTQQTGSFDEEETLVKGISTYTLFEASTYVNPDFLPYSKNLIFLHEKLIKAVTCIDEERGHYIDDDQSLCFRLTEWLLKLPEWDTKILKESIVASGVDLVDLLRFLKQVDVYGFPIFFSLKWQHVETLLTLASKQNLQVDFSDIDRALLFFAWYDCFLDSNFKRTDFYQLIHRVIPSLFEGSYQGKSTFVAAALYGCERSFIEFIHSLSSGHSPFDQLVYKILRGDQNISLPDHSENPEWQFDLFQISNKYIHKGLLEQLNKLGIKIGIPVNSDFTKGFGLFPCNATALDISNILDIYLSDLRKAGCLFKRSEIDGLCQQTWRLRENFDGLDQLVGKRWVEKVFRDCGISSVRVPKMVVAVEESVDAITVAVDERGGVKFSEKSDVYQEVISPFQNDERFPTDEEWQELIRALKSTGCCKCNPSSIVYGKNQAGEVGFFLLDVSFSNFSPDLPNYTQIKELQRHEICRNKPDLLTKIRINIEREEAIFNEMMQKYKDTHQTILNDELTVRTRYGFIGRREPFSINLKQIVNQFSPVYSYIKLSVLQRALRIFQ